MPEIEISPSILAADMGYLAADCQRAESAGADSLHIDIMDGEFVNNISMGFGIIKTVKKAVDIPLTAHLMILHPDKYVQRCVEFGADSVFIHIESPCDILSTLRLIREHGGRAGITLNPATPLSDIKDVLEDVDGVLFMSVYPGFGGQAFKPEVLPKIRELRKLKPDIDICVDGGLDSDISIECVKNGANVLMIGSALFKQDMAKEIQYIREKVAELKI